MLHKKFLFSFIRIVQLFIVLLVTFNIFWIQTDAQSTPNAILLSISKVTKDGQTQSTQNTAPNTWRFDDELNLDDAIRYSWNAVNLDLACKDNPRPACGYVKIYLNDDSTESNLITEHGTSPLPVEKVSPRLAEGENRILFVYINSQNPTDTSTKVSFTFRFRNTTTRPQIKILEPTDGVLLGEGIDRNFRIELTNFQLESTDSLQQNRGKLNIYFNEINPVNLLGTISTSSSGEDGKHFVNFTTNDISNFSTVPDSLNTTLFFVLTRTNGEILDTRVQLPVRTNYQRSLDVGLPKVTITEPRRDRSNLTVDANQKFIVQVDNFDLLQEFTRGEPENGKGYLQIIIDGEPVTTLWPKTDFSIAELGRSDLGEGRKTVKVQLVNKNFTPLIPEATDMIDVVYAPGAEAESEAQTTQVQNNTWRIILVILIVVLVIGGIAVLITKG